MEQAATKSTSFQEKLHCAWGKLRLQCQGKNKPYHPIPRDRHTLWYTSPAADSYSGWERQALPLGNGYMGAKIFGGIARERIQLNEKTLWTGGLHLPGSKGGNSKDDQGRSLKKIQALLAEGSFEDATKAMEELQGDEIGLGAYQNFGDLFLEFHRKESASDYIRDLNLDTAAASVEYRRGEAAVRREYFMSYPSRVLVGKICCKGGLISATLRLSSAQKGHPASEENRIFLSGALENGLNYGGVLEVTTPDGQIHAHTDGALTVSDASEFSFFLTLATDYALRYPDYRSGMNPLEFCRENTAKAVQKGYAALYQEHLADYQPLFRRVALTVGEQAPAYPTDVLLQRYKYGENDSALEMLYFQYGRYLLLASSRPGSLPANLQGVWNAKNDPIWQSDYHLNINLQMNYWPALSANLTETAEPLLDYVQSLVQPGRVTACQYAGIGERLPDGTPDSSRPTGWMTHTQNNIFGHTGPGSEWRWGWAPGVGAFILQNIYEIYRFTMDVDLLAEKIYPMMEEAALLWTKLLIEDPKTGRMVSSPSYSAEHGPVTAGNTFDQTLVWQLYTDVLEAADALRETEKGDVHEKILHAVREQLPRLQPALIGKWGQMKEWVNEDEWPDRGLSSRQVQKHHRHMSHLLGLFPGRLITENEPELLEAARTSLHDRGDGGTGWSKAQKICAWARLLDGDHSHRMLEQLLKKSTLDDLWDTHPPFQIDGNFGAAAGIVEMLLQSHAGTISLLPALPSCWSQAGSVSGLLARGGFEVSMEWSDNALNKARLTSHCGRTAQIQAPDTLVQVQDSLGQTIPFAKEGPVFSFETKPKETYTLYFHI